MVEKISVMETNDSRINKILEILLKYIDKDFSHTIPISKKEDEIDALSAGLNTMAEELKAYIAETKKQAEQIRKMNRSTGARGNRTD
jgi:methyl-accepting chemotaxis protein